MKSNVYPCKPLYNILYYIKVGFNGVKIILVCFRDGNEIFQNKSEDTKEMP